MAVDIKVISCPAGSYTLLAQDKTNCTFQLRTVGSGRLAISATQPAANTSDYFRVTSSDPAELGSLSGTEDVYFMPEGTSAIEIEVIRG